MILLFSLAAWLITITSAPGGPNGETTFLIAIFTATAWRRPDSHGPTLLIVLHVLHWILVGRPAFLTLTALAVTLVAIHHAAAVAETISILRHVPPSLLLSWAWRTTVVVATTPVVLGLPSARPINSTAAPILVGIALLALALTAWWLTPSAEGRNNRTPQPKHSEVGRGSGRQSSHPDTQPPSCHPNLNLWTVSTPTGEGSSVDRG